jgi:hypothetical protein
MKTISAHLELSLADENLCQRRQLMADVSAISQRYDVNESCDR